MNMTITLLTLLKRRPGLSRDEFVKQYETRHRLIGERVLRGYATRYVRRHLQPVDGVDQDCDADVVLEIDFPDQPTMDACFKAMADPEVAAIIAEDEATLFDRSRIRSFTIDERWSVMPPVSH